MIRTKVYIAAGMAAWLLVILLLGVWNVSQANASQNQIYLESGRAFFNLIVLTREWNAEHGGVYVPISADIQPNPYLDVPNRDIETPNGMKLTLINPAYMTRLIGELAAEKDNLRFHITSLNPIRPANAPEDWEAAALNRFMTRSQQEYYAYQQDNRGRTIFRFMAPLMTQQSCMKCHARQGYQVGDVRGGISVSFPVKFNTPWGLIFSHGLLGVVGSGLIFFYGKKIERSVRVLENLSNMDGLTQIHNRRFFEESLTREFLYSRRNKTALSVAVCDIDNFKAYNDFYGHQAGDDCLKKVALAMAEVLKRPGDLVARYGGEEFGIILPHTTDEGALMIGNMLRAKVEALQIEHKASNASVFVTVSVGVSTYAGEGMHIKNLVNFADQALYKAKSNGRNCVCSLDGKPEAA